MGSWTSVLHAVPVAIRAGGSMGVVARCETTAKTKAVGRFGKPHPPYDRIILFVSFEMEQCAACRAVVRGSGDKRASVDDQSLNFQPSGVDAEAPHVACDD